MFRRTQALLGAAALAGLASGAIAARPQDTVVPAGHAIGSVNPSEAVLYDNMPTGTETVFSSGSSPRTGGADEALFNGPGANISSMQFGFLVASNGPSAFDVRIRLWDDLEPTGSTVAGVPQFVNLVKDFTVSFTGQTAGAFITTPITIPTGGANVTANPITLGVPNVTDVYVQLDFYDPGTQNHVAADGVTYIFDGSGVNVGRTFADPALGGDGTAATELYWRDVNNNQIISVDEARNFAAPNRANWTLHLEGTLIPEPATISLAALGSLGFLARRRRA
jgi:hypothetical protein